MTHEQQIIKAVKKVMPAVVSITAAKDLADLQKMAQQMTPFGYPPPDELLSPQGQLPEGALPTTEDGKVRLGGGSGFIVDKSGIILTNRHVVLDPDAEYTILTHDDQTHRVKVVARDLIHDIAILKVENPDGKPLKLPIVSLSKKEALNLGQTVIAIGNALGEFKNTVSTGVVSGLSRFISAITDMSGQQERLRGLIQTDAAINPGNSGGPLINLVGEVIGVNVAIVFGAQNIGFAVPIKKAKRDMDDIKKYNHIRRPYLGVRYVLINKALAARFHLPLVQGALVLKEAIPGDHAVIPGSPADRGGVKEGDIITACNDRKITERDSLEDMLEGLGVGDKIQLSVLRNGTENISAHIVLEERSS